MARALARGRSSVGRETVPPGARQRSGVRALGLAYSYRIGASDWFRFGLVRNADDQSVDQQAAQADSGAQQGSGDGGVPAEARRLHARLHDDSEKAEFGL